MRIFYRNTMISNPTQKVMLTHLNNEIKTFLKDNFIGTYVHGSLATGDAVSSSDIDVVIVIKKDITQKRSSHYSNYIINYMMNWNLLGDSD